MTAVPRRRHAWLRSASFALIATGMCNACGQPAPPQAAPQSDAKQAEVAQTTPMPDEVLMPPPAASTTGPAVESPVQTPPPMPIPTPLPPPTNAAQIPRPAPPAPAPATDDARPTSVVVTALSRGKGVPAETRDAYKRIRLVLEQRQANATVTALQTERIGLEGETRLCAEFQDAKDAQDAMAEIRKLAAGVDLLNVVEAPCPTRKDYKP